jgi:hypothetical protein
MRFELLEYAFRNFKFMHAHAPAHTKIHRGTGINAPGEREIGGGWRVGGTDSERLCHEKRRSGCFVLGGVTRVCGSGVAILKERKRQDLDVHHNIAAHVSR